MTSSINPNTINGLYPVAGQDNDSQGFRDNFTNIKNNFTYAKSELEDLQGKVVLKSALTGGTLNNDFNGQLLKEARIQDFREQIKDHGNVTGSLTVSHADGHFQLMTLTGATNITFTNFPSSSASLPATAGRIRLQVTVSDPTHYLGLEFAKNFRGIDYLAGYVFKNSGGDQYRRIYFKEAGTYLYEFVSIDAGTNFSVIDLSQMRRIPVIASAPAAVGAQGDSAGALLATASHLYVAVADWDGTTAIWKRIALSSY